MKIARLLILSLLLVVASLQIGNSQCDFTISNSAPCALSPVNFSVVSPSGSYGWDFNNDMVIDAYGNNVTYAYPESYITVNYPVTLYLNGVACEVQNVLVGGTPDPTIGVIPGSGILENNLIRVCSGDVDISLELYNASATIATNATYTINWGDGTIETYDNTTFPNTSSISHDYSGFGYYALSLTVEGINGCTNVQYYTLYNGGNPSVGLANPGNTVGLCAPATIDFPITNTTTNPTGTIYNVYISGQLVATYTQNNVPSVFSYTFLETSCGFSTSTGNYENAYDVQIEATNPCGSSQATIEPIELSTPPEVTFEIDEPAVSCEGETFTISNTSTGINEVVSGNPSTCTSLAPSWTITPGIPGVDYIIVSGNVFNAEELEIVFLTPGTYTITMSVVSPSCGSGTYSEDIEVYEAPGAEAVTTLASAAAPAISDDCAPTLGMFENISTGDSLTYAWSISPGTGWEFIDTFNFTTEDLLVLFNTEGEYTVSLIATNFCSSEIWDTVIVIANEPEVTLDPIPDFCETATLDFSPASVGIQANYGILSSVQWSFPGATPSSSSDTYPTGIHYDSPGTYTVSVTVTNQCGTATTTQDFFIQAAGTITIDDDLAVCEDAAPFMVNATPTGGTWSGDGVSSDGTFTPSSQVVGVNTLTYSYQDGACLLTETMEVTVHPLPLVDPGSDQIACVNDSPFLIDGGLPLGGDWTVNNGGVIIGLNVFDPIASGAGVYTLTYTFTDKEGCSNQASKTIIINNLPTVEAGNNQSICENPNDIQLTGFTPAGGVWTGMGVTATGVFNANSTPGIGDYTLYYNFTHPSTGCSNLDSIVVSVIANPVADAGDNEVVCLNADPFVITTGTPIGGTWSGPGVNSTTNEFDPSTAGIGTHTLTYSFGIGVCETTDTKTITVQDIPEIIIPNDQTLCIDAPDMDLSSATPAGGVWTGTGINGTNFEPATAGLGSHILTYTYNDVVSGCENTASLTVEVVPLPEIIVNDTSYCNTPGLVQLPVVSPMGGTWSGTGVSGTQFDPIGAGGVGNYTLTYSFTDANSCFNSSTIDVAVIDPTIVEAGNNQEVCINNGIINLNIGASPVGGTWSANGSSGLSGSFFDPAVAGTGTHTLTYSLGTGNCLVTDEMTIVVNPLPVVQADEDYEVCVNETAVTLSAAPLGGTWTSNDGGVITGNIFNPNASGDGVFSFTYTFVDGFGCSNSDELVITVNPLPVLMANDTSYCNTPGWVSLPAVSPTGGTWSGNGVVVDQFDPQGAGGVGTYTVTYTYTDNNTCSNSIDVEITVIDPENINAGIDFDICVDNGPIDLSQMATPTGGSWNSNGSPGLNGTTFNPSIAGAGIHVLTYTIGTGNCQVSDEVEIVINPLPIVVASDDFEVCVSEKSVVLTAFPTGGVWVSNNGGVLGGNIFNAEASGPGVFSFTYTFTDNNGCANSDDVLITVNDLPQLFTNDTTYCNTPGAVNLPFTNPTGGTWSGIGVTGDEFDPQLAGGAGTYEATYSFTDGNGCENSIISTINVIEPDLIFAGNDTTVCIDGTAFDLGINALPMGGTWDTNGSSGLNGTIFDPAIAGVGVHTLTYHIGFGNCAVSDDIVITVQALPIVEAGLDRDICYGEPAFNLSGFSPLGGTWSGIGITNTQNGTFDPTITPGAYTLVYTYADNIGCVNADSLVVTVMPLPEVNAGPDTAFCAQAIEVQLAPATPAGGFWTGQGITNANLGVFNPIFAGGTGTYELIYTYTNPITTCVNSDTLLATVIEPAIVEAGPNDTLCIDQGIYQLFAFTPANGTWTGTGIVDAENGLFDPVTAGGGLHILTYTYGAGSCLVQDTKTIYVVDLSYVDPGADETTCFTYDPIILTGYSPAGGTWSGTGITDAVNGIFDPAVAQAGTHELTYTFVDPVSGCVTQPIRTMTVYPMEEADFIMPDVACRNEVINFDNLTPATYDMLWNFGDGSATSTAFEPTHVFDVADTYTVTLIAENEYGCKDTVEHSIIITDVPVAYFVPDTTEECVGLDLSLSNQSVGYGLTYEWNFGNGQISSEMNPDIVFFGQGLSDTTYVISLTVSNQCGTSTFQDIVTIHPAPQAGIGLSPQTDCSPLVMDFANISTGAATSFFWDYGNGNTSNELIPETQQYFTDTTVSVYTVTLISSNVCGSDTVTTEVVVEPANVQAFFGVSEDEGCEPFTVDFYNYATPGATIDWDFGDGNTSSVPSPTHTFEEPGIYNVIQYANSDCGYDTTTLKITVLPAPEVAFEHNQFICFGEVVSFVNQSENTTGNLWDFGDGSSSQLTNPTHVYAAPGEYTVTLTGVSAFNQCPAEYSSIVTVLPLPSANFEPASYFGCAPFALEFTNNSGAADFYQWDFGDGNTSIEANPTHVFAEMGVYEVSLIATDLNGCSNDTSIVNITVHPRPDAAFDFSRESLCGLPAEIQFENGSQGASGYLWHLGTGDSTILNNPTSYYDSPGYFDIVLVASNQFGCSDTSSNEIRIYPEPQAEFEIDITEGCEPLEVVFENRSEDSNGYNWDFGDGGSSTEQNPVYVYEESGQFDVLLVATVDDACSDTISLSNLVTVHDTPFANFEAVSLALDQSDGTYEMVNLSEDATEYYWEFSDGVTSDEVNPVHRFTTNGANQIYLEASTNFGCVDDTLITMVPDYFRGLFLPNGFSPEQGIGDVRLFKPKGVGIKEFHVRIFSTYGELLWESTALKDGQPSEAWDGTVGGKVMPQDVYVWKCFAIFEDGTVWKGEKDKNGNYKTMGSVILLR